MPTHLVKGMEVPLSFLLLHYSSFLQEIGDDVTSLGVKLEVESDVHVLPLGNVCEMVSTCVRKQVVFQQHGAIV